MSRAFTILELLVAVTILIVGILGVSQLVALGMSYNVEMRQLLAARHILERRMESFEILPINDPWLVDPENDPNNIDYDDSLRISDYFDSTIVDNLVYYRYWNVVAGRRGMVLDDRFRTLRIFVQWTTRRVHRLSNDYIRWEER